MIVGNLSGVSLFPFTIASIILGWSEPRFTKQCVMPASQIASKKAKDAVYILVRRWSVSRMCSFRKRLCLSGEEQDRRDRQILEEREAVRFRKKEDCEMDVRTRGCLYRQSQGFTPCPPPPPPPNPNCGEMHPISIRSPWRVNEQETCKVIDPADRRGTILES